MGVRARRRSIAGPSARWGALLVALAGCGSIELGVDRGGAPGAVTDGGLPAGCTPRTPPPYPLVWPYAPTKAAYQARFYDALPGRAGCAVVGCHARDPAAPTAPPTAPLIVASAAELDAPMVLADAIEQLWARARPDPVRGVPPLLWEHGPSGGMRPPVYGPEQLTYLTAFVDAARACAWAPVVAMEQGRPPACDATGVCECPLPTAAALADCAR